MKRERVTILAIDDDTGDAELLRRHLGGMRTIEAEFLYASSPEDARLILADHDVDLVLLDYCLGAKSGLEVLTEMRSAGDRRPIIMVTGAGDENAAADLTRAGADEYVVKKNINSATLEKAIKRARDRCIERKAAEAAARLHQHIAESNIELAHESRTDLLTQLLNRRAWGECASLEQARCVRHDHVYSILMLDVDHFKLYNDSLGHPKGDECLKAIAYALRDAARTTDIVGRYGGEEFILLAPEISALKAQTLAEKLGKAIRDLDIQHPGNGSVGIVTVSIGVAEGPSAQWLDVVDRADRALYAAKHQGRNRCVGWSESLDVRLENTRAI